MSASANHSLPAAGRAFVAAVGVSGLVVVAHCIAALARSGVPLQWVALALLTFATGTFTLKVPSVPVRLSVSEVFAFAAVLLYGPEMGAITVALDALFISLRWRMSPTQTVFNSANLAISVWVSGRVFFLVAGVPPLFTSAAPTAGLILPLGVLALTYFVLNSGLTATIIAVDTRRPVARVWREHFLRLTPTYAAGASVALLLVVALRQVNVGAFALIIPLVAISYLTMRSSFGRLEDAKTHVEKLNRMYLSTVETLATAIDAKDEVTHGHIRRVQSAAVSLARELGVSDELTIKAIEAAALLHDTGKIAVPEHILNKPGKLTAAEYEKMKLHAPIGAEILSCIDFPYPVVPIVRHHHENWDGTGYPDKLKGTDIPIGARILSVVDCFDALTSDRPYRRRMSDEDALKILIDRRGTMYDPMVVEAFVRSYKQIMPTETVPHPAARAVGGARALGREAASEAAKPSFDACAAEEVLAVTSLARAVSGEASLNDVGALCWMMLKQVVPAAAMAIFVPDEDADLVVSRYAAGVHAASLRGLAMAPGSGIVGWVAANRRTAVNAEPSLDLPGAFDMTPALGSALALPLVHDGVLVAVLCVYAQLPAAYTEDHARLLELMAPQLAASAARAQPSEARTARIKRAEVELRIVKRA